MEGTDCAPAALTPAFCCRRWRLWVWIGDCPVNVACQNPPKLLMLLQMLSAEVLDGMVNIVRRMPRILADEELAAAWGPVTPPGQQGALRKAKGADIAGMVQASDAINMCR